MIYSYTGSKARTKNYNYRFLISHLQGFPYWRDGGGGSHPPANTPPPTGNSGHSLDAHSPLDTHSPYLETLPPVDSPLTKVHLLLYHFCFNFIVFVNTGHGSFDFNPF